MFLTVFQQSGVFLTATIEKEVGPVIGVLVSILGFIMNLFFNLAYMLTDKHSLGISIIFMTLVIKLLMVPQGISTQKSQIKMKKVQPEIDKIKKKYGNSKDPEIQKKINMETQAVYSKNKINLFGGCLPLLITLPIFYAMMDLMRRLYLYVDKVRDLYIQICHTLYMIPGIAEVGSELHKIAVPKVYEGTLIDIRIAEDLMRFIDKFSEADWDIIMAQVTNPDVLAKLNELLLQRDNIQHFLGLNLVANSGLYWPGIIIPVLSAVTNIFMSYLTQKMSPANDQSAKINGRMMMIAMPVMMFFFTLNVSGGVGVYWIASNLFSVIQMVILNRVFMKKMGAGGDILGKATEKA